MKKLYLLSALCLPLLSAPALADDHYNYGNTGSSYDAGKSGSFTGPYVGATVDYSWTKGDGNSTFSGNDSATEDGIQGGVLAGYGLQFDPGMLHSIWSGYTAFELGYEWNGSNSGNLNGLSVDKGDTFIASVRPGVTWGNQVLGYGIVGYSRSKFTVGGDEQWLDGYSVGAGTELATVGPLKTRLEYVYTNYNSENFATGPGTSANYNPHDNAIKLGAIAHF